MIAVTGDLIDGSVDHLRNDLEPFMDLSAPYGTYFVTGIMSIIQALISGLMKLTDLE